MAAEPDASSSVTVEEGEPDFIEAFLEWQDTVLEPARARGERKDPFETGSGIPVDPLYTPADLNAHDPLRHEGFPGVPPFTRGIQPTMYRGRLWSIRQYAGYGTASDANARFRYLLAQGQPGLSVAFDLPTQMGLDSDDPRSTGEVGQVGVAIDSVRDMEDLFVGIPLSAVSTSMTINAPAPVLVAMYVVAAERQGLDRGVDHGDGPERRAQGVRRSRNLHLSAASVTAPRCGSDRLVHAQRAEVQSDLAVRISHPRGGKHRRAGDGVRDRQRVRIRSGVHRARRRRRRVRAQALVDLQHPHRFLRGDRQVPSAATSLVAHHGRTISARVDPRSLMLRTHTQTGGSTLTAQQPENNIVRAAIEALAAVLGGVQSLALSCYDEALSIPTEKAQRIAVRTQQIIAEEIGVTNTVDPLGGSYYVEWLTDELEREARRLLDEIDERGGAVACIETGLDAAAHPGRGVSHRARDRGRRQGDRRRQPVHRDRGGWRAPALPA